MFDECIDIFLEEYEKSKGKLILNEYNLSLGNYYFVEIESGEVIASLEVDKNTDNTGEMSRQFKERDYLSILLEMNKPLDGKKQIHSNNYRSFFVKKDKLSGDLSSLRTAIEGYYAVLEDYAKKYDKRKMELLKSLDIKERSVRLEEIKKIRSWINDKVASFQDLEGYKDDKNYLKIFFVTSKEAIQEGTSENLEDLSIYEEESRKYFIPNIYNKNDYNEVIEGEIFGAPNNNFGLNSKKPYLVQHSRKTKVPILLSQENAMKHKLFFDFLYAVASRKEYNLYIGKKKTEEGYINVIQSFESNRALETSGFVGYFLRLMKEKNEAEIVDFDILPSYRFETEQIEIKDCLNLRKQIRHDEYYREEPIKIGHAVEILDKALFGHRLRNSYFLDGSDVSKDEAVLKKGILDIRKMMIDWQFKGKGLPNFNSFQRITTDLLIRHLEKNQYASFVNAYNVQRSFLKYIDDQANKGKRGIDLMSEKRMWDKLKDEVIKADKEKVEIEPFYLENEKEFAFAVGQLWKYLLTLSEAADKNYSMVKPLLNEIKVEKIQTMTNILVKKYGHGMSLRSKRANRLLGAVMAWDDQEKINNTNAILAGLATTSIIYFKEAE